VNIRLLNAKRLAEELGRGQISNRTKAHYLFAGMVMWVVITFSGLAVPAYLWSWVSFVEAIGLIVITMLGFSYVYEAAGGDTNSDFVVQFTCLSLPVSVTTVLVVWGIYWGIYFGFRESLEAISESRIQFAINLSRIGTNLFGALILLGALLVPAITFYRINRLFRIVRNQSTVVIPVPDAAAAGRASGSS
jgi:hypothetical protein